MKKEALENLIFTCHSKMQKNLLVSFEQMDRKNRIPQRESHKRENIAENNKRQEIVEIYDCSHPEGMKRRCLIIN